MASMTEQQFVFAGAGLASRSRASWRPMSDMSLMSGMATAKAAYACAAPAIAHATTANGINGLKPFTRWPEEPPT
jgi:hypothetical protein